MSLVLRLGHGNDGRSRQSNDGKCCGFQSASWVSPDVMITQPVRRCLPTSTSGRPNGSLHEPQPTDGFVSLSSVAAYFLNEAAWRQRRFTVHSRSS